MYKISQKFCLNERLTGFEIEIWNSADDVRDVVNVSSAEVPDAEVLKMIKRAEVTLELETA